MVRAFSDDIEDMFPAFDTPLARASTNSSALKATLADFQGTAVASAFVRCERRLGREVNGSTPVTPFNTSMVMGDLNAVDYGMGAHLAILRQEPSVLPDSQWARPDKPFPLGPRVQTVVVDDRVGLCVQPSGRRRADPEMLDAFERGAQLIESAGLRTSPGKRVRNARHSNPLG